MKKFTFFLYISFALLLATCQPSPTPPFTNLDSSPPVAPEFIEFYQQHNGLRTLGVPISADINENGIVVQYFQNGRLEYHPQLPEGSQVLLSTLGKEIYGLAPCLPPENVEPNALFFDATCHSVSPGVRNYFLDNGGVSFFGYPVSEMYIADGRLVQHFERATIVWNGTEFNLAGLGYRACPPSVCTSDPGGSYAPEPIPPTSEPNQDDAIESFYKAHSGASLFGPQAGGRQTGEDGAKEQVCEKVILYENPSAPEGVSLRPLGLKMPGALEPPAPQTDAPNSFYSTKFGHNVIYTMYEFFNSHGGVEMFGHPLSEVRVEDGKLVQYFENAAIIWRSGSPTEEASKLLNLGQQSLPPSAINLNTTTRPNPPQMLTLSKEVLYPTYPVDDGLPQVLKVWVQDENSSPVAGANAVFTVKTPAGNQQYASVTDVAGFASASFALSAYKNREYMTYNIRVSYGNLSAGIEDSFLPWGAK
jgi:hypothetical protein